MARDLTNRVIVITGASSGIGAATAVACADAGMDVVLNARREDKLGILAERIRARGRKAEIVTGSVTEPGLSERMLDAAMSRLGRCDAVFANAGYGFHLPMHKTSEAMLREIFEVNFFAGVDLLQKAAARWIESGRTGHLLMCSSCLARFTIPQHGPYCATKASQNHICRAMNVELRPHRIYVSSVHPIGTKTEFFETSAKLTNGSAYSELISSNTPSLFMQPPERVANAIVRCLRRPRPEVWTSFTVRAMAAMMTLCPRIGHWMMLSAERRAKRIEARLRRDPHANSAA